MHNEIDMCFNIRKGKNMEEQKRKFFKPGPLAAVLVFLVDILATLFIFSYAQYYLGMWGLVLTEVGIGVIALCAAIVFKVNLREMLPFKKIKVNQFFGTLVIWGGAFLAVIVINMIMFYFFPEGLQVSTDLNEFFGSWPALASIFVISVTPAIFEEMLHRGFIQTCIRKKIHNKWVVCIIMGTFFGLFHLDLYRFLGTAILGGVLAYILIETDNFWYNMLFHFFNNFIIDFVAILAGNDTTEAATELTSNGLPLIAVAVYLIIGSATPIILLGGSMLLKGLTKLKQEGKKKIIISVIVATVIAILLFSAGVILIIGVISSGGIKEIVK